VIFGSGDTPVFRWSVYSVNSVGHCGGVSVFSFQFSRDDQSAFLDRSGVRFGMRVEHRVIGNGWLHASGGWMVGRELIVQGTNGQNLFESDADGGAYFGAGFAWRF
jgi:hypothetical protein